MSNLLLAFLTISLVLFVGLTYFIFFDEEDDYDELEKQGLGRPAKEAEFELFKTSKEAVSILCDGNY